MPKSPYSFSRSKTIFFQTLQFYRKKKLKISSEMLEPLHTHLKELENALLKRDRSQADFFAKKCESLVASFAKKSPMRKLGELLGALLFALTFAIIVRQMWFELYEIPTGSMRPTLMEQDRLVVSKTDFGLNIPLTTGHFYFDPLHVKRNGIVTFTGENMDIPDADTRYFLLFPGKKQFVKRLMGKPGDILYFYGGQIYGIDKEGRNISSSLQSVEIEHIPFLKWEGQITIPPRPSTGGIYSPIIVHQMGHPVAVLNASQLGKVQGRLLPLTNIHDALSPSPADYSELFGFGNFAMARLLQPNEMPKDFDASLIDKGLLYLELSHHPSLQRLTLVRDLQQRHRPAFDCSLSYLPLDKVLLQNLFKALYTSRFIVKDGLMHRYGMSKDEWKYTSFFPNLDDVPDGTYEFIAGKAYQIGFEGLSKELPLDHALYTFSLERVQLFFNLGIECNTLFAPSKGIATLRPARYAYFREGDLFVMGQKLLSRGHPFLLRFLEIEYEKTTQQPRYIAFTDCGPPYLPDGSLNIDRIKRYGLLIPERSYLALGDNHAMSGDSRVFGFVPQENLRGGPFWIFWPLGERWGEPHQPPYPWLTLPTVTVWVALIVIMGSWWFIRRRRTRLPVKDL